MFNARLLALLPAVRKNIALSVAARWLALLCQVALFAWVGAALGALLGAEAGAGASAPGALSSEALATSGALPADALAASGVPSTVGLVASGFPSPGGLAASGVLSPGSLAVPAACIVAIALLQALARWCAGRAGSVAGATLSELVFGRSVELGAARGRVMGDGALVALMGEGIETLRPYFSRYVPQFFYAVLASVTLFFAVAAFDVVAAVVLLVCVPLMPLSIMVLMRGAKRHMGAYWGAYVDLGGAFLDAVRGLTTLKVFGTDGRAHERLDAQAEEFRAVTMKLLRVQLQSVTFMDLFTYGGIAVGCVVVCVRACAGDVGPGDALTIMLLSSGFFLPMRTFGSYFHTGMNANPVIDQLFTLLDADVPADGTETIEGAQVTIEARGLSYAYGPSGGGLADVDVAIRPNSFIGVAGPSGSGKSTLASLLAGDLAGYAGSLRINSVELREARARSVHDTVTLVSRSSHVFRGTFRGNLEIAAPGVGDAALWDALRRARLADFVYESGGLDAPVEADGANLSGGQRQRLVFARALLRNTPVYVFDEATANIDAESERYLLAAIQKIALSKTVIVVSHRLPVLRYADEILVMREGRVAERGTHEELLARGGTYRAMWDKSAELEAFAASVVEELPEEGPDEVEEALAGMPGMMAGVMRAFMGIAEAERYRGAGTGGKPAGHPSWIPLPDYRAGMSRDDDESAGVGSDDARMKVAESGVVLAGFGEKGAKGAKGEGSISGEYGERNGKGDDSADRAAYEAFGKAPDEALPGIMGLADATTEGEDAAAIREAMRTVGAHMLRAQPVRVRVEPLPPAHRPALAIVAKCLRLTSDMVPRLALAVVLGCLGWLLTCAVLAFSAAGVLAAFEHGLAGGPFASPAACLACACVCALLRGPVHYAERLLTHDCTFGTVADIRSRVFGQLRALAPAKVEGRDAGDLISLLTSDIDILEGFYSRALVPVAASIAAAAVCVVLAGCVNLPVAAALLVTYAVVGAVVPTIALRVTRERGAELRSYAVLMTGFLLDSLRGMRDLLAFGRAQEYADELGGHLDSMSSGENAHVRVTAALAALPHALSLVGTVAVACVCVGQASCGALQVPWAVLLAVGAAASMDIVTSVAGLGTSFDQVLAAADRVLDVMEERPVVEEPADPVGVDGFDGLAFENVTFGYEPGIVAVDDASFEVAPGAFVGIAGKSGVGKTTLLKLAMRFWDVDEGAVRVNGVDVRRIRLGELRGLVNYLVQDTYLFKGTLRENLLVARPDATDEQLEDALEKAAMLETVRSWPLGLDTVLCVESYDTVVSNGESAAGNGESAAGTPEPGEARDFARTSVSDGERQRIGLARAFLHDAPLFLLDEPTSNLDALNEAAILRSLCLHAQGKTVVIVSHRRAVAAIVDKLLVVE